VDVHNAILALIKANAPELKGLAPIPPDMLSLVEAGAPSAAAVRAVHDAITKLKASGRFTEPGGSHRVFYPERGIKYLPPIPNPSKVYGAAGAYIRKNADGTPGSYDNVEYPSFFLKPPSSLTGHESEINLEGLLTRGVHEPEMAVIISKTAKDVPVAQAMDYVFGYSILNDVSARDLPAGKHNSQGSTISKGLDTFSPFGPYITLKEDVPDPHKLEVYAVLDGERHKWPVPNGNTSFLTFTIPEAIAYLSERMTLLPGDVISTGVPQPSVTFKEGQTAEIVIEGLGTLRNKVVSKPVPGHKKFPARKVPGAAPPATD
jgi:2-keto-4-pentenoate hydratase/2-oxohepta-3-ene-1,7-dioic acid hydratase in catechol pathway